MRDGADANTPIPGGTGNFTNLGSPVSLGGGDVAFFGFGSSGQSGIYNAILEDPAPVINGFNGGGNILIKNTRNFISISNMTPNKKAAVIWGFKKRNVVIGGGKCAGTVLGINPFQLLAKLKANGSGNVNKTFFVPQTGPSRAFIQILDLASCVPGAVVPVILVND